MPARLQEAIDIKGILHIIELFILTHFDRVRRKLRIRPERMNKAQ